MSESFDKRYSDAQKHIKTLERLGSKLGLETMRELLARLGKPQERLKYVHLAGTNGKGSTAAMTAAALTVAGYRTGLYVSPSVYDFSDRMQINMKPCDKEAFLRAFDKVVVHSAQMEADNLPAPTEFETVTAIAFELYADQKCDIVVLETGLGGRFDATNIITSPLLSMIMSISKDHTSLLGGTLAQIAMEKCGIIKENRPTICYPEQNPEALVVIEEKCKAKNSPLHIPDMTKYTYLGPGEVGERFSYNDKAYETGMPGEHFAKNALCALCALELLQKEGFELGNSHIRRGIGFRHFSARMEIVHTQPIIVFDGAHNPDAALQLRDTVKRRWPSKRVITLMGIFADKDYAACISTVASISDIFIATKPEHERGLDAEIAAEIARGKAGIVSISKDPKEAFQSAWRLCHEDDILLCCGSFSLFGTLRDELEKM